MAAEMTSLECVRSETDPTRIIACEVMKEELLAVPLHREVEFEFVSMGLHRWPDKMREELRRFLAETDGVRRVVLAFGLCGGAVSGLAAASAELHIPRAHDCIPVLLGSSYSHESLLQEEKGTFFLSGGWLEASELGISPAVPAKLTSTNSRSSWLLPRCSS
ncbi:DUF1638 domain-containing protein [Geomonas edaphica]|uniref:DUF1638 domain-containing protein n=1 Tax=Geomonas edaphica TaxID=2570226 RepID=UPI0010A8DA8D|nr:DUF1638 domain-containing protein [Geomonas edaphica]